MEIRQTDRVKNEVLHRIKEQRNTLHTAKMRTAAWIGHMCRNCLLKQIIEGKIEMTGRRGRGCKQLLGDLKERRGYCKLKEEALDHNIWRSGFGRDCER